MMLTTISLVSLIRPHDLCVSCNKKIKTERQTFYESGNKFNRWNGRVLMIYDYISSNDVERIEGHVYDYKCNKCCSDRDYNMSDKYNISHPIKEYMGEIIMNGESIHTIKGEKVNQ